MFTRRLVMFAALAASTVGCERATPVPEQVATVACGMCRFHIEGSTSCYWAVELDGQVLPVSGADTPDHDSHGPDGMCVVDRRARVAGRIKGGRFLAETFELLPADDVDPSAAPPPHDHTHAAR